MGAKQAVRRTVDRALPGAARRYRAYRDSHTKRYDTAQSTPWGFELFGDEALAESRHQSHEADLYLSLLGEVEHVVDVGANVGLFTLLAASKGLPVTAVEPSPMNLEVLYRNLRHNRLDVEIIAAALSESPGLADLYGGGQGASLLPGWGGMRSTYATPVPVLTLDGLFADRLAGRPALVKIDAEGAELPILQGARRLVNADVAPRWIIEVGLTENFDGRVNPDFEAIFDLFWSAGYRAECVEVPGREVTPADVERWVLDADRGFWNINYLFTRD